MNAHDRGPEDTPKTVSDTADLAFRLGEAMKRGESQAGTEGLDTTRTTPEDLVLGRLALETGKITPDQLREALRQQEQAAGRGEKLSLESYFLARNWIPADALAALKAPPVKPPDPVQAPSRYELQNLVGQGATAMVYRAWDRELKRPVALKMLRETAAMSETARARFRREAQVAAGLSHPNIVRCTTRVSGRAALPGDGAGRGRPFSEMLTTPPSTCQAARASGAGLPRRRGRPRPRHRPPRPQARERPHHRRRDGEVETSAWLISSRRPRSSRRPARRWELPHMSPEQVEGRTGRSGTDVYAGAIL
jgi:hypothetical protein